MTIVRLIWFAAVCLLHHTLIEHVKGQTFEAVVMQTALPTVTVRGFLNFRTTVDGTVIVFTPASAGPSIQSITPSLQTSTFSPMTSSAVPPASVFSVNQRPSQQAFETPALPTVTARSFPSTSSITPTASSLATAQGAYPTGLVTVLSSSAVHNGLTTELHTHVYGTYINGKYAQILKSSARLVQPTAVQSPVFSIASTAIPTQPSNPINYQQQPRWPSPNDQPTLRPSHTTPAIRDLENENEHKSEERNSVQVKPNRLSRLGLNSARFQQSRAQHKLRLNRFKSSKPVVTQKIKEEEEAAKQINQRFNRRLGVNRHSPFHRTTESPVSLSNKNVPSEQNDFTDSNFKNINNNNNNNNNNEESTAVDRRSSIEASNSNDFKSEAYLEESAPKATFSSVLAGNGLQNDDPLNLSNDQLLLQASGSAQNANNRLNDLNADDDLLNASHDATPALVLTRTYSIAESSTRTSVVPMIALGGGIVNQTITEAFVMQKLITAYRTIPPGDLLVLPTEQPDVVPSISEKYTLGNVNDYWQPFPPLRNQTSSSLQSTTLNLNNPDFLRKALQQPKVAALYQALQRLEPQMTVNSVRVRPTERLHSSTVYQTKRISFYDGRRTRTRYITDSGSLVTATETILITETVPAINSLLLPQQQQIKSAFAANLKSFAQSLNSQSIAAQQSIELPAIVPTTTQTAIESAPTESIVPSIGSLSASFENLSASSSIESSNPTPASASTQSLPDLDSLLASFAPFASSSASSAAAAASSSSLSTAAIAPLPSVSQLTTLPVAPPSVFDPFKIITPIVNTVVTTVTKVTQAIDTQTRIYTLIYNGFSTRYRTVTSTSIVPSTVTMVSTQLVTSTPMFDLNAFLG